MPGRMRLVAFSAALLSFLVILAGAPVPVSATPPSAISLSFDKSTGELKVTITHASQDVNSHYIYKVEIKKNGTVYNTSLYTSQPDPNMFTYTYNVQAGDGDILEVTATCILFGSLAVDYDVTTGKTTTTGTSAYSLWPFHASMMATGVILGAISISSVYMKKKPWWFRGHKWLGAAGAGLMVAGVLVAAYMIAASGGTQFRVPHAWLGLTTLILVLASLSLGMVYVYSNRLKKAMRGPHLWMGRVIPVLAVINILLGLVLVGLLAMG